MGLPKFSHSTTPCVGSVSQLSQVSDLIKNPLLSVTLVEVEFSK